MFKEKNYLKDQYMTNMRLSIGRRRSVIKGVYRFAFLLLNGLLKNLVLFLYRVRVVGTEENLGQGFIV